MGGGLAVTGGKTGGGVGAGAPFSWGDYTARRFPPPVLSGGLALTAWGPQAPISPIQSARECALTQAVLYVFDRCSWQCVWSSWVRRELDIHRVWLLRAAITTRC